MFHCSLSSLCYCEHKQQQVKTPPLLSTVRTACTNVCVHACVRVEKLRRNGRWRPANRTGEQRCFHLGRSAEPLQQEWPVVGDWSQSVQGHRVGQEAPWRLSGHPALCRRGCDGTWCFLFVFMLDYAQLTFGFFGLFVLGVGSLYCFSSWQEVCATLSEATADWRVGGNRTQPGQAEKRKNYLSES